jgi:hypothetical protein
MMTREIEPLRPDDIPELSRFLTAGFHTAPDADFAAPDVLRWKYFDPRGGGDVPRSYVAREGGRIIGHLGVCTGSFLGRAVPGGEVSTLHMIDWLSAQRGSSIGAHLMMRAHRQTQTQTQYGLGGSTAGRSVGGGGGYSLVDTVPVFQKVVRPTYRLRAPQEGRAQALAGWARDWVRTVRNRGRAPRARVELRAVRAFGPEVEPILDAYQAHAVFTNRRPELLNHLLRYPRGGITGWLLVRDGAVRGFALLSMVRRGVVRIGKLTDCVLDDLDPAAWHAAVHALTGELRAQSADVVQGFASTAWMARALQECGFIEAHRLEFRLRDRSRLLPPGATFHLTPLEADYAYA